MTPLERLYAEELPTGTFGGARQPDTDEPAPRTTPVTPAQAAANLRNLEAALTRPRPRRHLHPVPTPTADTPSSAA
jgi:hypothetical protein